MKYKNILKGALFTFLMIMAILATAEEKKGIVRDVQEVILGNRENRLMLSVDTTDNRIPDHYLLFPDPTSSELSRSIALFTEKGMKIIFDNEGFDVLRTGSREGSGDNTTSLNDVNMLELFPNERARFRFAAEALDRQRGN
jgi:hypothetical protein